MSTRTIYMSRLIGLYCIVVIPSLVIHKQATVDSIMDLFNSPSLMLFTGIIAVAVGLAMILAHNIWTGGALPVAVTLFGWALYFSGLLLLFASPERLIAMVEGMKLERNLPVYALVTGLVGLYFLGAGLIG